MNWKNLMPKPKNLIPFYYVFRGQNEEHEKEKSILRKLPKGLISKIYGLAVLGFLFAWGINGVITRDPNPINAVTRAIEGYNLIKENERIYPNKYSQIFGPNGYADANRDNIIDFPERIDAYRRMGFFQDVLPIAGETEFPKPNLNQLERAIRSYEK